MSKELEVKLMTGELSRKIQDADPLGADHFMIEVLPVLNNSGKVGEILQVSIGIIPSTEEIEKMDYHQAQAGLRDLGIIASSIQRHGVDFGDVPSLEQSMVEIGLSLNETPRETVFHYGPWNPIGERTRTFTALDEERAFIQSFREGMSGLDESINNLLYLQSKPVHDLNFGHTLDLAKEGFQKMVNAMVEVRRKITPEFFTFEMRPYFPVLKLNGQEYQAPGGAQMPVLLVDRILWGVDQKDETYQRYYAENLKYLPKAYKNIDQAIGSESVVTRLLRESEGVVSSSVKESTSSLLNSLLMFRYPHLKTAKENFKKREDSSKGSGGYTTTILEKLINLTSKSKKRIDTK